jgi:CRP-like cAMP-binding protein
VSRLVLDGLRWLKILLVLLHPVVFVTDRKLLSGTRVNARMAKIVGQELSVLSSSKQGLVYLTANDWALVVDKASLVQFKEGAILIQKGKRANGVYLLLKGSARVVIPSQASRTLGPGEICGEMSFLEDSAASVSVIAEADIEAYHLDRATLQTLFELFPHLASRFYRSLAMNLSRRLRELIGPSSELPASVQKPLA